MGWRDYLSLGDNKSEIVTDLNAVLRKLNMLEPLTVVTLYSLQKMCEVEKKPQFLDVLWKLIDTTGAGVATAEEARNTLRRFARKSSVEEKIQLLWCLHKRGNDNGLTRPEVLSEITESCKQNSIRLDKAKIDTLVEGLFAEMDPNATGRITFQQFRDYMVNKRSRQLKQLTLNEDRRDKSRSIFLEGAEISALDSAIREHDAAGSSSVNPNHVSISVDPPSRARIRTMQAGNTNSVALTGSSVPYNYYDDDFSPLTLWKRFKIGMRIEGSKRIAFLLWVLANVVCFLWRFFEVYAGAVTKTVGLGAPFAKGFGNVINLNCALLLLPMCKKLLTWIRNMPRTQFIPFDKNIVFHKAFGIAMAVAAVGHTLAHVANFIIVSGLPLADVNALLKLSLTPTENSFFYWVFATIPGLTGVLLLVVIGIMYVFALFKKMRRKHFNFFIYSHHLYIIFYILLFAHVGRMYLGIPITYHWCALPVLVYIIERLIRLPRQMKARLLTESIVTPNGVLQLEIEKPFPYKSGQFVAICCPAVSATEWHPFTISSAPTEPVMRFSIMAAGDWTSKMRSLLGKRYSAPSSDSEDTGNVHKLKPNVSIYVDGPFGAASEEVFRYKVVLMVGAGIGATPFASIIRNVIKAMQLRHLGADTIDNPCYIDKAYFYWLNREPALFDWFKDVLCGIFNSDTQRLIKVKTYLTRATNKNDIRSFLLWNALDVYLEKNKKDMLTGLPYRTYWGRPDFSDTFDAMIEKYPGERIGVFFCGPPALSKELYALALKKNLNKKGTEFCYHKENF